MSFRSSTGSPGQAHLCWSTRKIDYVTAATCATRVPLFLFLGDNARLVQFKTDAAVLSGAIAPAGETLVSLIPEGQSCTAKAKHCKLGGEIGAVVIGEAMTARIIPYAKSIGAGYYQPDFSVPESE